MLTNNFKSPLALFLFFGITILGLTADLASKHVAYATLVREMAPDAEGRLQPIASREVHFISGWLHFQATNNYGAVFGIGQGQRWLFVVVSVVAIAFLTALFAKSGRAPLYQFTLGLLLAGVLGNLYDRSMFGYVRDMIHALPQWPRLFPWIFNIADSLLCCGVGLMILQYLLVGEPKKEVEVEPQSSV